MKKVRVRRRLLRSLRLLRLSRLLRDASARAWVPMPPVFLLLYGLVGAFIAVAASGLWLFVNVQHLPDVVSAL